MRNIAVLLAGGSGTRMHAELPKQFLLLAGKTVLQHVVDTFVASSLIDEICLVLPRSSFSWVEGAAWWKEITKPIKIIEGGASRTLSSYSAYSAYCNVMDGVNLLFHDVARALLSLRDLECVLRTLSLHDGVVLGAPTTDTIYELDARGGIQRILDRSLLWSAQTPQVFRGTVLRRAFECWKSAGALSYSDDVSLVKSMIPEADIHLVVAQDFNMKITTPADMMVAEYYKSKKS